MKVAYVMAAQKFMNMCLQSLVIAFLPVLLKDKQVSDQWIGFIFRYLFTLDDNKFIVSLL